MGSKKSKKCALISHVVKQEVLITLPMNILNFGGKQLWQVLSDLFVSMYSTHNAPSSLKIQLLLPIFKGKNLKASNKDNYRGITLFSVFCKVFELLLQDHLESIAQEQNYFSDLQFGFSNGVGCIEASYVISESVNQAVEQGDKVFACFLDVSSVQFSSFIYFRICKYNEIDLNKNKNNTHNNRFYNLISSINSI